MSLPSTLYTLAAIGFFALMASRPAVELPTPTHTNPAATAASDSTTESADEPSTASTNSAAPDAAITPNAPPQTSDPSPSSQPAITNTY